MNNSLGTDLSEGYEPKITAIMQQLESAGADVYNLGVDDMVADAPTEAKELAVQYIDENRSYYTGPSGHPALRDALSGWLSDSGHIYSHDEIVVGPGSRWLLYAALSAAGQRSGEAVLFAPFAPEYPAAIAMAGLLPRVIYLESPFKLTPESCDAAISPDTRVVCVQSPSQPAGTVADPAILRWLLEHTTDDVYIIWDGLYRGLSYGTGIDAMPLLEGTAKQRVIMLGGLSMTFAMSAWRIGYMCAPRSIASSVVSMQTTLALQPSSFLQKAASSVLHTHSAVRTALMKDLTAQRDYAVHRLLGVKGISFWPPEAGFYLFISIEQLLGEFYPDAQDWCIGLLEKEHVALVPGDQFGMRGYVRMNFSVDQAILHEAIRGIIRFAEHCILLNEKPARSSAAAYLQPPAR